MGPIGVIVIRHDPDLHYGVWLEVANQGRFAIIAPAIDYWGPRVQRSLQNMANLGLVTFAD